MSRPDVGGFGVGVTWVRFSKHISLFSTLPQWESLDLWGFPDLVQRLVSENLRLFKHLTVQSKPI